MTGEKNYKQHGFYGINKNAGLNTGVVQSGKTGVRTHKVRYSGAYHFHYLTRSEFISVGRNDIFVPVEAFLPQTTTSALPFIVFIDVDKTVTFFHFTG